MLLSKSTSLPQIKVNFNKYDNFFSRKSTLKDKDGALDEPEEEVVISEIEKTTDSKKKTHLRNLEIIDRKSTLRSKVDSYLTDSRKLGILDHSSNETNTRRSLTKISLQTMKSSHTQAEQQNIYLTSLKGQLNDYFQKNQIMSRQIKSCQAMTSQVKEKIIFYDQLLSRSWIHRYELLNQREENLVYIRYESDRLKFMQERLKEINMVMRKRVKDAQNMLKTSENQVKALNQMQCIKQDQLDNKLYLLKHYEQFQLRKSDNIGFKTDTAMRNMQETEAVELLKRHQKSINILDHQDYEDELKLTAHQRLTKEMLLQKMYKRLLDSVWTKYSRFYQSYEKAEQLIKMYSLDRQCLVQDSYIKSFQIKKDLQKTISSKEKQVAVLQQKNRELKSNFGEYKFSQIQQIEKRIQKIKLQFKTGKKLFSENQSKEMQQSAKMVINRLEEAEKARNLLIRLKQWMIKQEKYFQMQFSKKQPLSQHFSYFIKTMYEQLTSKQTHYIQTKSKVPAKPVPKTNKYGNLKKKK